MRTSRTTSGLISAFVLTLGSAILDVPAAAAETPPPSNVQISWSSAAHTAVRVIWDEPGDRPNHILVLTADGGGTGDGGVYTDAGQPNVAVERCTPSHTLTCRPPAPESGQTIFEPVSALATQSWRPCRAGPCAVLEVAGRTYGGW